MLQNVIQSLVSNTDGEYALRPAGYAALAVLVILILVIIAAMGKKPEKMNTRQLTFCSMALALATVTSFIKFGSLPFGGSITFFSMFFICFIGYLYGAKIGVMTGLAYGILQFIVGPYIFHPVQILLDYPMAFGALGLSGVFAKSKYGLLKGYAIGVLGRYICHVISGYVFFKEYAPEGMNPMLYTLGYNATYIVPEFIITVVLLCIPAVIAGFAQVKKTAYEGR